MYDEDCDVDDDFLVVSRYSVIVEGSDVDDAATDTICDIVVGSFIANDRILVADLTVDEAAVSDTDSVGSNGLVVVALPWLGVTLVVLSTLLPLQM